MKNLLAFLRGIHEFRLTYCTSYCDLSQDYWYDVGREFAHRITLRHYES